MGNFLRTVFLPGFAATLILASCGKAEFSQNSRVERERIFTAANSSSASILGKWRILTPFRAFNAGGHEIAELHTARFTDQNELCLNGKCSHKVIFRVSTYVPFDLACRYSVVGNGLRITTCNCNGNIGQVCSGAATMIQDLFKFDSRGNREKSLLLPGEQKIQTFHGNRYKESLTFVGP